MENSTQRRVIYRVKGLRADAIIPIKVIPAIYHLGTASRSRAGLKSARDRAPGRVGKPGEADAGWPPAEW